MTFYEYFKFKGPSKNLKTEYGLLILLFIVSALISLKFSPNFIGGIGVFKAYFLEPILFFYCLVLTTKKTGSYKYVINSLIVAGVWLSLLSLLQKLTHSFTLAPHEIALDRVSAVYNSANSLALFLGPIALLTLARFISPTNIKKKLFYLSLFLFFTLVIVWTRSRGGMMAEFLSITIFLYALLAIKNRFIKKFWYLLPVVSLLGVTLFFYSIYRNYNRFIRSELHAVSLRDNFFPIDYGKPYTTGDTLQIRFFIWSGTINMLKDHPVTGAGLNGFKTLYTNQYRLPEYQEQFQYPHNLLLSFWAETGIYGLFAFLMIVVSSFGILIRNLSKSKKPILGASLIAVLSFWLIHGIVDVPYFKNDLSLEFWTIIALVEVWRGNLRS